MDLFRTAIPVTPSKIKISHQDQILCLGSCFAEHMTHYLNGFKFKTLLNPFGILYNPISIANGIELILSGEKIAENQLFEHMGLWHSSMHHSQFSNINKEDALLAINNSLEASHHFLKKSNRILITLGTAYVFENKETGQVVGNCHKLPASNFNRFRLSLEQITKQLSYVFASLKNSNPDIEIICTVSPVRHVKDGFINNQRSKATLLLVIDQLVEKMNFVHYFPSYELLMDDLRDYRFYKEDMIHPNDQAIKYIWKYFSDTYFEATTHKLINDIKSIQKAVNHRPFQPDSAEHLQFIKRQIQQLSTLEDRYPFLDFKQERKILTKQII